MFIWIDDKKYITAINKKFIRFFKRLRLQGAKNTRLPSPEYFVDQTDYLVLRTNCLPKPNIVNRKYSYFKRAHGSTANFHYK